MFEGIFRFSTSERCLKITEKDKSLIQHCEQSEGPPEKAQSAQSAQSKHRVTSIFLTYFQNTENTE